MIFSLRLNSRLFIFSQHTSRDNIIPICLPSMDYPLEGKIGVVAGWGKTDNSFGKTGTNLLNKVGLLHSGSIFVENVFAPRFSGINKSKL